MERSRYLIDRFINRKCSEPYLKICPTQEISIVVNIGSMTCQTCLRRFFTSVYIKVKLTIKVGTTINAANINAHKDLDSLSGCTFLKRAFSFIMS